MRLVVFGLTVSSSWGNGHATLWRALCRALAAMGHHVVFFERDVPYYAAHRDAADLGCELVLHPGLAEATPRARRELEQADAAIVTSYCPDALAATALVLESRVATRAFYDLDTPVTLARLRAGEAVEYLPPSGLGDFDLVLSFTGGRALDELRTRLGAGRVAPLYGTVDPTVHRPVARSPELYADLSYLGTYAHDRQPAVEALFFDVARVRLARRFVLGGSMYPDGLRWPANVFWKPHVAPPDHPAFFSSSVLTLNVTRRAMTTFGFCPSGRLFEAAACGAPIVSDAWEGLDAFFEPDREILVARTTSDVCHALDCGRADLAAIAHAARKRVLAEHRSEVRAEQLVSLLESA